MKSAVRSIDVDVSPERFYALITDFARYPEFVPNQTQARIQSVDGQRWRIEFVLSVARKLTYTLDLVGEPVSSLSWNLVHGDMMKANDGGWSLEPLDGGTRTKATYRLAVELAGFVPRTVANALIEKTLPATLEAFKREAERRG